MASHIGGPRRTDSLRTYVRATRIAGGLSLVVLCGAIAWDLANDGFWSRHSLFTSLVASAIVVAVTAAALTEVLEDFNALIAVNVAGFFHMTTRAIKQMLDQGRGHVVNVSTSLVEQPDSSRPAALQTLTKGGLVAITRSLAIEYASRGLRVNAVSLGVIKTPLHDESSYAGMGALHPIGRVGEIEDVVAGVLYLESAPFVTGEILHIDGGQSAGH